MGSPAPPAALALLIENTLKAAGLAVEDFTILLYLALNPWARNRDTRINTLSKQFTNIVSLLPQWLWEIFLQSFEEPLSALPGVFIKAFNDLAPNALRDAGLPATAALNFVLTPLKGAGIIKPGQQDSIAQSTFGRAWTMGELAHGLAILSGILPDNVAWGFEGMAALVSEASGFREIAQAIHRSWYGIGFARPTSYEANKQFRTLYPAHTDGHDLLARGLITPAQRDELDSFGGLTPDYTAAMQAAAYTGMQPRQLIRLIETGLFTTDDIKDELTFRGMRPASQARMLLGVPYLATQTQRSQLISALESAYAAGLLADADYTARVDSAWQNSDRDSLALAAAQLRKLVKLAADLETEYTTLYRASLIDDATFRSYLSGIGLQPDYVDALAGKAEASANATLQRATLASARALERATAAEERKAAMKGYATGALDAAALLAALLATGLTPTQASAWTALAALQSSGNLRWLYGLQLSPAQASQLRARVTALTDQRKRLQIDAPTYDSQLKALGIGDAWRNALEATADAMITPKASAFAIPVSTS